MNAPPTWLPAQAIVRPWRNNTYDLLYRIFCRDFKDTPARYRTYDVWFFSELENGKEKIFWHLTDREDPVTRTRYPDLERSARLPWARAMLDSHSATEILAWDYLEGDGGVKTYVWLKDCSYVVILKVMKNKSRRLITSFWIDYPHTRKKMMKKYEDRIKEKGNA
jgi:hypothetical protein